MTLTDKTGLRFQNTPIAGAMRAGTVVWRKGEPPFKRLTPAMTSATTPSPFVVTYNGTGNPKDGAGWNAFDQKPSTQLHSGSGQTTGFWCAVDLGAMRNVKNCVMTSRDAAPYQQDTPSQVTIQSSADGTSWHTEKTVSGIPVPPAPNSVFLDEQLDFTARHIRFEFVNTRGRGYQVISEIELYGF